MPKPRRLSGPEVVAILERFGFTIERKRGSHAKLVRSSGGERQVLIVPMHEELKTGTIVGIFRQGTRYISEEELRPHFYTK